MEYKLVDGRPENSDGREEKEMKVYDLLDSLNISYQRIDHEELMTMELCAEVDKVIDAHICKNLLLRNTQKTKFYLLMMPGDKKFKTKELSAQINSARLSFAEPEYMEQFLNIRPGSLSVMGLMNDKNNDVQLLIDDDTLAAEYVGVHPTVNTSSVKLKVKDLIEKFLPAVKHNYIPVKLIGED